MRRPWTDEQLARARKMLAAGVPKQQIDRYFGRARNSIFQALARRDDPAKRGSNGASVQGLAGCAVG